jgi:hypothetical protein
MTRSPSSNWGQLGAGAREQDRRGDQPQVPQTRVVGNRA